MISEERKKKMKIYDISQEIFSCEVYPNDPRPEKERLLAMENGDLYNLTKFSMCAHNGTHVDAPFHFIASGKTIDEVEIEKFVGECFVAEFEGVIDGNDAENILAKIDGEAKKRILLKGDLTVSLEAACVFADAGIYLLANEAQALGPFDAPMAVHLELLGKEVIILEGIRLSDVPEGKYILCAAPLNLKGSDGAPCRAVLIDLK